MLESPGGREAVKTMVDRGKADNRFKILTKDKAELVLKLPHNFANLPLKSRKGLTTENVGDPL